MRKCAIHVDSLTYGCVFLELHLVVPELGLSYQDHCYRAHGIKLIVQEKVKFFECVNVNHFITGGTGNSRDRIRRYFSNEFFSNHCATTRWVC